jgi:hypothetical protein
MLNRKVASSPIPQSPPRSLYRKIQRVISEARKGKARSIEQLIVNIDKAGHLDFTRYGQVDGRPAVLPCSAETIARVVNLCIALKLLTEAGALTQQGTIAAQPDQFNAALRPAIESRLAILGAPMSRVRQIAADILAAARHDVLPTWDEMFQRLDSNVKRLEFKDLLGLLAACGGIKFSRKKIYFAR